MVPAPQVKAPAGTPVPLAAFAAFAAAAAATAPSGTPVAVFEPFTAGRERLARRASRLPLGHELGMGALLRFKALMAAEGQPVHVARMCYDRLYAYERIASAHASADDPLRRLALELFQIYHRTEAATPARPQ